MYNFQRCITITDYWEQPDEIYVVAKVWETDEKRAGQALRNVEHEIMVLMSKESLVKPSTLLTWVHNYEKSNQDSPRDC
jgi:hypothetical protein